MMSSKWRTLVESELYTKQLSELGDPQYVDEKLRSLLWGIATTPESFELIPGTKRLCVAKTTIFDDSEGRLVRLRLWFSIESGDDVLLRAIEKTEEEELLPQG